MCPWTYTTPLFSHVFGFSSSNHLVISVSLPFVFLISSSSVKFVVTSNLSSCNSCISTDPLSSIFNWLMKASSPKKVVAILVSGLSRSYLHDRISALVFDFPGSCLMIKS